MGKRRTMNRFRVIVDGISVYTTRKQILEVGLGDRMSVNLAVIDAFYALRKMREDEKIKPVGLTGHWEGHNVQIDMWWNMGLA